MFVTSLVTSCTKNENKFPFLYVVIRVLALSSRFGEGLVVPENQQVIQGFRYLLKGVYITHLHWRVTGDFWEVGVWLQSLLHRKSREPFPTLNISYSWAWGWKACDGLQKYKMFNVVSVSRRNTFIFLKERTERECFKKKIVFSMTHVVQN